MSVSFGAINVIVTSWFPFRYARRYKLLKHFAIMKNGNNLSLFKYDMYSMRASGFENIQVILILYHLQPFCIFSLQKSFLKLELKTLWAFEGFEFLILQALDTVEIFERSTSKSPCVQHCHNLREFDVEISERSTLSQSPSCRNFERFKIADEG